VGLFILVTQHCQWSPEVVGKVVGQTLEKASYNAENFKKKQDEMYSWNSSAWLMFVCGAHVRVPTRRMTHGVRSVCVAKMPSLNVF
jgi:hypothetical protein